MITAKLEGREFDSPGAWNFSQNFSYNYSSSKLKKFRNVLQKRKATVTIYAALTIICKKCGTVTCSLKHTSTVNNTFTKPYRTETNCEGNNHNKKKLMNS